MPIGYGRWDFVKRSAGQNIVVKAAYNSRSRIEFQGNVTTGAKVYDYSYREAPVSHFVLLPKGASERFLDPQTLWNEAERKEIKINSQPGFEGVLALPDDEQISTENRVELAKEFLVEQFVKKGLAVQLDIHQPDKIFTFTKDNSDLNVKVGEGGKLLREEKDGYVVGIQKGNQIDRTVKFNPKTFTDFEYREHNWHAHFLVTSRRFTSDGKELGKKARDLVPQLRSLKSMNRASVVEKSGFGKKWEEHQNEFFINRGVDLRVDPSGVIPQKHLGPVRMRARAFDLLEEYESRLSDNKLLCGNVGDVLEKITEQRSIFDKRHVDAFIEKHVDLVGDQKEIKDKFWKQSEVVSLLDPKTQQTSGYFSTQTLVRDERVLSRLAEKMHEQEGFKVHEGDALKAVSKEELSVEQKEAFEALLNGTKLGCLQGFAGTGKGRVLSALREAYSSSGYKVRGFGTDNATADVLKSKKFWDAENVYKFMFAAHHGNRNIRKGGEVWICDEASKLGNRPFAEFLKLASREKAQVIFCGDAKQISSIDRGGIFTYLQERYGAQSLKDIQRQKNEEQKYISKALATGNVGAAFNAIDSMQGFKWSQSKNEAIQSLIDEWAKDSLSSPQSRSLMVAHSNAIVNTLNELARTVRKERGELSTQEEFCCETKFGNLYVSPGDKIQFRKKDFDLGITNGLVGTLVKAEENKFTVLVDQGGKFKRKVIFNPQEYNAFQLGYATTYFRSQGDTVDRCYVLDSPHLNKENFYVGLTRHVNKVRYFVYKDAVKNLTDLKSKAMKDESKRCTLHYITGQDIEIGKVAQKRASEINRLKESNEFMSKAKGHFLEIKDSIGRGFGKKVESIVDLKPEKSFFNPKLPDEGVVRVNVSKVVGGWEDESLPQASPILEKERAVLSDLYKPKSEQLRFTTLLKQKEWKGMGIESQSVLKGYFKSSKEASNLYQAVKAESEFSGRGLNTCLNYSAWQKACAHRNEVAYQVAKEVGDESGVKLLGEKSYEIVRTLAGRYEAVLDKDSQRQQAHNDLKGSLEKNVGALLYKLFPEGPTSKTPSQMRFGSKGALCVNTSGAKAGLFYNHENQEGGDLLKLIQSVHGSNKQEAKEWVSGFLDIASEIQVPSTFTRASQSESQDMSWTSIKPPANSTPPQLKEVNPGLSFYYNEEARHSYTDEQGSLIYQVLRLRSIQNPSEKMTPPLSFGYSDGGDENPCWRIKGFKQDAKRPLYNLYELAQNPSKTVLIVEGEKTADKALEKLPKENLVCITWSGGASAVSKADWSPLVGRKIVVWPDNDVAGFKAAESVCDEMKKVGAREVYLVEDKSLFESLPEKWDLADSLPDKLDPRMLEDQLYKNKKEALLDSVITQSPACKACPVEAYKTRELLSSYEKRTTPVLDVQLTKADSYSQKEALIWEYKQSALNFIESSSEIKNKISSDPLINAKGDLAENLTTQILLYKAKTGRDPSLNEINTMKQVIGQLEKEWGVKAGKDLDQGPYNLAKNSLFEKYCTKALTGKEIDKQDVITSKGEVIGRAEQITQRLSLEGNIKLINQEKAIESVKQPSLGIGY